MTRKPTIDYMLVEQLDPNEETETPKSPKHRYKLLTPLRLEGENLKQIRKQLKRGKKP